MPTEFTNRLFMQYSLSHSGIKWVILFILLFLCTQDYLLKKWPADTIVVGLPSWILWFVFVHVVFIISFFLFSGLYWKEDDDTKHNP